MPIENIFTQLRKNMPPALPPGATPGINPDAKHPLSQENRFRDILLQARSVADLELKAASSEEEIKRRLEEADEVDQSQISKALSSVLIPEYKALAKKTGRSISDIATERLKGLHWSKILLRDMISALGQGTFKTEHQRQLEVVQAERAANIQRMGIIADSLESFDRTQASREATSVTERNTELSVLDKIAGRTATRAEDTRGLYNKRVGDELALQRDKEKEDHAQENRLELERFRQRGRTSTTKGPQPQREKEFATFVSEDGSTWFQEGTVKTTQSGNLVRKPSDHFYRKPPSEGEKASLRVRKAGISNLRDVSKSLKNTLKEGRDPRLIPTREFLRGFIEPLAAAFDLSEETLKDLRLTDDEAALGENYRGFILKSIVENSGKQVTDSERTFVISTLPNIKSPTSVYTVGVNMARISAELGQVRISDREYLGGGQTRTGDLANGKWTYHDKTETLKEIHAHAQKIAGKDGRGSAKAAEFLESINGADIDASFMRAKKKFSATEPSTTEVKQATPEQIRRIQDALK